MENVKKAMHHFNHAWRDVHSVYSPTRFVTHPANYVPEGYFHLASQVEDLG